MSNVIQAYFSAGNRVKTRPAWLQDHGMVLKLEGLELPPAYEVHFSNSPNVEAFVVIGDENGAVIPDELFLDGVSIYAWVYLHTGTDDGWTAYEAIIPLLHRPGTTEETPTPSEQSAIEQAIAALNSAVVRTDRSADSAEDSAEQASGSASLAAQSAEAAERDRQAIEDMSVTSHTLAAGYEATVQKQVDTHGAVNLDFGIPRGRDAVLVRAEGMYGFQVDERGHLILTYSGEEAPNYSINAEGHLILTV